MTNRQLMTMNVPPARNTACSTPGILGSASRLRPCPGRGDTDRDTDGDTDRDTDTAEPRSPAGPERVPTRGARAPSGAAQAPGSGRAPPGPGSPRAAGQGKGRVRAG